MRGDEALFLLHVDDESAAAWKKSGYPGYVLDARGYSCMYPIGNDHTCILLVSTPLNVLQWHAKTSTNSPRCTDLYFWSTAMRLDWLDRRQRTLPAYNHIGSGKSASALWTYGNMSALSIFHKGGTG